MEEHETADDNGRHGCRIYPLHRRHGGRLVLISGACGSRNLKCGGIKRIKLSFPFYIKIAIVVYEYVSNLIIVLIIFQKTQELNVV